MKLFKKLTHTLPGLSHKLRQAGIEVKPEDFIRKTMFSAFYMTTGVLVLIAALLAKQEVLFRILLIFYPIVFIAMFFYFLRLPDVKTLKRMREINYEIIDAGRFLIVELESGVPLFESLCGVIKNFNSIGKYFKQIVDEVNTGSSIEQAITDIIEYTPSHDFRRLLWQILNSLRTGADVVPSLKQVIEQISREHLIEIKRYGYRLNPLAMAYMIFAVILPSLGVTLLVVFSSFVSLEIDLLVLILIALLLGFIQLMFVAIAKSSRPAVNM